jgi:hypothetical protein
MVYDCLHIERFCLAITYIRCHRCDLYLPFRPFSLE